MTHRAKLQCQVNPRVAVQIQIRNKTIGAIEVGSVVEVLNILEPLS